MKFPKQFHVIDYMKNKHRLFLNEEIDWYVTTQEKSIREILQLAEGRNFIDREAYIEVASSMAIRGAHMAVAGVSLCLDGEIQEGWYLLRKSQIYRFFKTYVCYPIWVSTPKKYCSSSSHYTIGTLSRDSCLAALSLVISPLEGEWLLNRMEEGLTSQCYDWSTTDFFAAYLVRLHRMPKGESDIPVQPPNVNQTWIHPYNAVFDNWNDETGLARAIREMCEYHLHANTRDWNGHFAEFADSSVAINPIEIHVLEHVRFQLGLLTPKVDHELTQTPLYPVPEFAKKITLEVMLAEDELLEKVINFINGWIKYPLCSSAGCLRLG